MRSGLRVVVFGILGHIPLAGIAWQALHYLEGFRRLGSDVHYVEDTGAWPYHPKGNGASEDSADTINYIARVMAWCSLADRWAYCSEPQGRRIFGLTSHQLAQVLEQADVLVNLTGATILREEHLRIPVRIYLETDPVQAQVKIAQGHHLTLDILLKQLPIPNRPNAQVPPTFPPYFQTVDRERRARMIERCAQPGSELAKRIQQIWLPLFTPPPPPTYVPREVFMENMGKAIDARFGDTVKAVEKLRARQKLAQIIYKSRFAGGDSTGDPDHRHGRRVAQTSCLWGKRTSCPFSWFQ